MQDLVRSILDGIGENARLPIGSFLDCKGGHGSTCWFKLGYSEDNESRRGNEKIGNTRSLNQGSCRFQEFVSVQSDNSRLSIGGR